MNPLAQFITMTVHPSAGQTSAPKGATAMAASRMAMSSTTMPLAAIPATAMSTMTMPMPQGPSSASTVPAGQQTVAKHEPLVCFAPGFNDSDVSGSEMGIASLPTMKQPPTASSTHRNLPYYSSTSGIESSGSLSLDEDFPADYSSPSESVEQRRRHPHQFPPSQRTPPLGGGYMVAFPREHDPGDGGMTGSDSDIGGASDNGWRRPQGQHTVPDINIPSAKPLRNDGVAGHGLPPIGVGGGPLAPHKPDPSPAPHPGRQAVGQTAPLCSFSPSPMAQGMGCIRSNDPDEPGGSTDTYGYMDVFVPELPDYLKCSLCQQGMRRPVQVPCRNGHRFCWDCLNEWLEEGEQVRCPVDWDTAVKVNQDNSCQREILEWTVLCENKPIGCTWKGCLKSLEAHISVDCNFCLRPCPNAEYGCALRLQKPDIIHHVANECSHKPVMIGCTHCGSSIVKLKEKEHLAECPDVEVQCPNGCAVAVIRRLTDQHFEDSCTKLFIPCAYAKYGCQEEMAKSKQQEHARQAAHQHIELLRNVIDAQEQEKMTLKQEAVALREIVERLEKKMESSAVVQEEQLQTMVERMCSSLLAQQMTVMKEELTKAEEAKKEDSASFSQVDVRLAELRKTVEETQALSVNLQDSLVDVKTDLQAVRDNALETVEVASTTAEAITNLEESLISLELTSYSGIYIWKIPDYDHHQQEAKSGNVKSLLSPAFYTSRHGYKMCARLYPNGDGSGKGSHLSVFFVIMQGQYDALLSWPFRQKVTLTLLDQCKDGRDIADTFLPDPSSQSFQRPKTVMNIASGCPRFVPLETVKHSRGFTRDNVMFLRIAVNTSDLLRY